MNGSVCFLFTVCFLLLHTGNHVLEAKEKIKIYDYFHTKIPDLKNNRGQLKWSKVITNLEELATEMNGESNMIKANVIHNSANLAFIESEDHTQESILSLEGFLEEFDKSGVTKTKGLMLHLKTQESFDSAMTLLDKADFKFPLWLHMNIGQGPGGNENTVDPKYSTNSNILDLYTTSLGLTTGLDPTSVYTEEMIKSMSTIMSEKNDFYAIRGVYLKKSWTAINGRSPLVIWVEDEDLNDINVTSLRNLLYKHRKFYFKDLPINLDTRINSFCMKNHDLYDFFKNEITSFDELKFHANVKSLHELLEALQKQEFHVIKAEINAENGEAFIENQSFKLGDLFKTMIGKRKAAKLHFLSTEAFETTMKHYKEVIQASDYPIWIEANVIEGPNGSQIPVNLNIENNSDFLSCHPLSLGLTSTSQDANREYTREMIKNLKALDEPDGPLIFYSFRAMYVYKSERLLDAEIGNAIFYFWAANEDDERIISNDLRYISRIYTDFYFLDIPEEMYSRLEQCPKNRNTLTYFKINVDAVKFTEFVEDGNDFGEKLKGDLHMIKARVFLEKDDDGNNAAYVGETSRYSLNQLFNEFLKPQFVKGLVLRFEETESFKLTVENFKNELRTIPKPIWLHVDVATGPGGSNSSLIQTEFLLHNDVMDCCTMVYGWSTSNDNSEKVYTQKQGSEMEEILKGRGLTVYAIRAEYASDETFENLRPLTNLDNLYAFLPKENRDVFIAKKFRDLLIWKLKYLFVDIEEHYLWDCAKNQDVMQFFEIGSLNMSRLLFSKKAIDSEGELDGYLNDENIHMIKANVKTTEDGTPVVTDSISLDGLLLKIEKSGKKKGLELTFLNNEAVEGAIASSLENLKKLQFPIWIRAFLAKGPGSSSTQKTTDLNYNYFNDILDCRITILAWTTDIKETVHGFTQNHIDELLTNDIWKVYNSDKGIIVEIRAEFLTSSWELIADNFKDNKFKIWIPDGDEGEHGVIITKDLRKVALKYFYKVYVDIPENLKKFLVECPPEQDVYLYFLKLDDLRRNASRLEFHESVRTLQELERAMLSGKHMINIEVYEKNEEAVVNKVPGEGDAIEVSLGDFLNAFEGKENINMGIQLLFKSTEAFVAAIKNNYEQIRNMKRPIWINANILKGPGDVEDIVDFDYKKYNDVIDCRTMILGWTTDSSGGVYTKEQIEEMKKISLGFSDKLYSIRLMNFVDSFKNLETLENEKLLLWASDGDVENFEVEKLRSLIEDNAERLFLDFSDDVRRSLNNGATIEVSLVLFLVIFLIEFVCNVKY